MTERKTPRNTTELPISVAIEKLREIGTERQAELDDAIEKATAKVYARFDERSRRIVARVPEELRQHVIDKAGLGGEVAPAPRAMPDGEGEVAEELPVGAREMPAEQRDRIGRMTGGRK